MMFCNSIMRSMWSGRGAGFWPLNPIQGMAQMIFEGDTRVGII